MKTQERKITVLGLDLDGQENAELEIDRLQNGNDVSVTP